MSTGTVDIDAGGFGFYFTAGGSGADGFCAGYVPLTTSIGSGGGNVALIGSDGFGVKFDSYGGTLALVNDIPGQEGSTTIATGQDFNTEAMYFVAFEKSGSTVTATVTRMSGGLNAVGTVPNAVAASTWHAMVGGASGGVSGQHWMTGIVAQYAYTVTQSPLWGIAWGVP